MRHMPVATVTIPSFVIQCSLKLWWSAITTKAVKSGAEAMMVATVPAFVSCSARFSSPW